MLFLTRPPITRLSQLRGALGLGLGLAAWAQWQNQTQQPLPNHYLHLPLPESADTVMATYLQAWGHPQLILRKASETLSLDQLLVWGLGSSDQAWADAGWLVSRSPSPQSPSGSHPSLKDTFLKNLYQALHGQLRISPILDHGLKMGMAQNNHTGAWAELSGELRGLLWGSLFGASYGWSCLPPLWISKIPSDIEILANHLFRAWAGQISGAKSGKPLGAITTAGYLYPR